MLKHIFFDLDHTLWDFDKNAEETLLELYEIYKLKDLGVNSTEDFVNTYTKNNHNLWALYHNGKISKETLRHERFHSTFIELGLDAKYIPKNFETDYVKLSPTKTNLFEGTKTVLNYLQQKYTLHIISNGFKEPTLTKMEVSDLNPYFENVFISELIGINKPDKAIFEYALNTAEAKKDQSIMIGDSLEADIYGALNYGMDAIFFNPNDIEKPKDVHKHINNLEELLNIL